MYSITGLEFSYSQAPSSMKSVLQAGWLLTTCFGNIIVIIIESAEFFEREVRTKTCGKYSFVDYLKVYKLMCN